MAGFQVELRQRDVCFISRRLALRRLAQHIFPDSDLLLKPGDARPGQESFDGIDPGHPSGDFGCFVRIPTRNAGGQQIELQQVAQGLKIPWIERQRRVDLSAKPACQKQLLDGSGMLRRDT